jgi:hypothetical protein
MLVNMLENFRPRVFRAVADHLSFRKAGEKLYLIQPAITLQIKTLEDEAGSKLFERRATGVTLKSLLHYAIQLARLAEEAENALANLKGRRAANSSWELPPLRNMYCLLVWQPSPGASRRSTSASQARIRSELSRG